MKSADILNLIGLTLNIIGTAGLFCIKSKKLNPINFKTSSFARKTGRTDSSQLIDAAIKSINDEVKEVIRFTNIDNNKSFIYFMIIFLGFVLQFSSVLVGYCSNLF